MVSLKVDEVKVSNILIMHQGNRRKIVERTSMSRYLDHHLGQKHYSAKHSVMTPPLEKLSSKMSLLVNSIAGPPNMVAPWFFIAFSFL